MTNLNNIRAILAKNISTGKVNNATFFKTGSGHYAEHDKFIGVSIPALRKIAKDFKDLNLDEIQSLIASVINEKRLLGLFILIDQYQKSQGLNKEKLYKFYVTNLKHVNNWNLVDASAHLIIGEHLLRSDKDLLITLAKSSMLWERRIAIR